jgi:hypothetical protein
MHFSIMFFALLLSVEKSAAFYVIFALDGLGLVVISHVLGDVPLGEEPLAVNAFYVVGSRFVHFRNVFSLFCLGEEKTGALQIVLTLDDFICVTVPHVSTQTQMTCESLGTQNTFERRRVDLFEVERSPVFRFEKDVTEFAVKSLDILMRQLDVFPESSFRSLVLVAVGTFLRHGNVATKLGDL